MFTVSSLFYSFVHLAGLDHLWRLHRCMAGAKTPLIHCSNMPNPESVRLCCGFYAKVDEPIVIKDYTGYK